MSLLLELNDSSILVFNSGSSRLELALLGLNLILKFTNGLIKSTRLTGLLLDRLDQCLTLAVGSTILTRLFLKESLVLHTVLDNLSKLLLIAVFELINPDPSLLFDALSLIDVGLLELFDHSLLLLVLIVFLELLESMLLLHLSLGFVLLQEELLNVLFKFKLLLLFRLNECIFTLLVRHHLLLVLLSLDSELLLMDSLQVSLLFLSLQIYLFLLHSQLTGSIFEVSFLLFDLVFKLCDLVIILCHSLLELHISCLILELNVSLESLDSFLNRIQSDLLDQNLLRLNDWMLLSEGLFCQRVVLSHTEAGKSAVNADREELRIVVV